MSSYPFSRWIAAGALLVMLAAGSSIALASAGGGAAVTPKCTIAGVRYVGTTSQKLEVCFTLSTDGKKLREYAHSFRDSCGSSTTRITNPRRGFLTILAANGTFSYHTDTQTSSFKGVARGGKASGTLSNHIYLLDCDTATVPWAAHRVGLGAANATAKPSSPRSFGADRIEDATPVWSPDGKEIAFTSNRTGSSLIHVMRADGSKQRSLGRVRGCRSAFPLWSPDGSKIAFLCFSSEEGTIVWLHVMSTSGKDPRRLARVVTSGDWGDFHLPAWSSDGRKLAFTSRGSSFDAPVRIAVIDADGSHLRLLTPAGSDRSFAGPAWSTDGKRIAFVISSRRENGIGVMNADGSNRHALVKTSQPPRGPAWSPDGSRIAFVTYDGIWVINADGSKQRLVTKDRPSSFSLPVWSPDSHRLAFAREGGDFWGRGYGIYVVNSDGTRQQLVTSDPNGVDSPAWSPDGRKIAYASRTGRGNGSDIYVMNADGSHKRRLTQ